MSIIALSFETCMSFEPSIQIYNIAQDTKWWEIRSKGDATGHKSEKNNLFDYCGEANFHNIQIITTLQLNGLLNMDICQYQMDLQIVSL